MKTAKTPLRELLGEISPADRAQTRLSFEISNKLDALMHERGLSKKQLADAIGKRPSEITRWLSGEHNFTIATLSMLSAFFGQPIVTVG
ncbi:MAG: helix-turn-helix transcriptional regulator [Bacteroides sp.]|nr:helix-turn-helix transcriptional regulator [Bacteroidales bacterium]MBD5325049.1 helix-turn-helix transcriptional regulator [Bacteroides sp.]MBD5415287.1 helix-turn-helix transcriptional regulator [Bacteroides sp.]MBD5425409.1 helix-turn-helix transcriptional regulator [Bacteroides sp.]